MKRIFGLVVVAGALLVAQPGFAAGCLKGAVVGGIAAHVTHHSTLLGALGGCIVGHVLAHPSSSITYDTVTGKLLGSDAELKKAQSTNQVAIVKVSTLKGYRPNDTKTDALIASSSAVKSLDAEIAGSAGLTSALQGAGFAPADVIAVSSGLLGGATLYVNK